MPCDYVITQSTCMSREEAKKAIKRTRRLLMSADDDAVSRKRLIWMWRLTC